MASASPAGMLHRLTSLVPPGWFSRDKAPIRDAVLGGAADALAWVAGQTATVRAGMRRATLTGWLLDLDAYDFLGSRFLRRKGESDDRWRARYLAEIFRPRSTRAAIIKAVTDETGRTPRFFEAFNPGDCGGYNTNSIAYAGGGSAAVEVSGYNDTFGGYGAGAFSYSVPSPGTGGAAGAGAWGSLEYPYQFFIDPLRPISEGVPYVAGYGTPAGGYGVGDIAYIDLALTAGAITDDEIYQTVADNTAAGCVPWTRIAT